MGVRIQTAMVIDDDDDFVELLTAILESRKIYVLSISNLEEAEQNLNFLKPTVIFLDNNFPEGLGVNFIRQIKDFDEDIRIVMMTADSSTWIRPRAFQCATPPCRDMQTDYAEPIGINKRVSLPQRRSWVQL